VSDRLLRPADLDRPEVFYPLALHHCGDCGLTQLGYTVDPRVVYRHFPFVSGTTRTATEHLQGLARALAERAGLAPGDLAVDVGSNDGTLLLGYRGRGLRVLGVDPSGEPVRVARARGIPTLHAFFGAETAEAIRRQHGPARAISAAGVFAHVADLDGLMRGVRGLLAPDGIFASDSQYWLDMVERGHYDNIFHQHLRYYSLRPLLRLLARYELEIFDVERSEVHGGSLLVWAGHPGARPVSPRVAALLALEEARGLYHPATWERFRHTAESRRDALAAEVRARRAQGLTVIGIGAPAKAATVCNYARLGPELIAYLTEVNPLRVGTYLPGVHIPIVDEARMFAAPPPAAGVLFAWNYAREIVPRLRARGWQGEVLTP